LSSDVLEVIGIAKAAPASLFGRVFYGGSGIVFSVVSGVFHCLSIFFY
jgi:hypothetical protein